MIGLIDFDFQTSTLEKLIPPNIEIMKLATYYRGEENIFCRLVSLNETELSGYYKIYIFSEQEQMPQLPPAFLRANNVILGGTAFTNGKYIPFSNSIIDFTIPKPAIYKDFLKEKYQQGVKATVISHILDDSYYRMYAGEERLPIPSIKRNKRFFIYDKDFFYPDWEKTLKRIIDKSPSSIVRIHPIVCNTLTQFFSLRNLPRIARTNEIILDTDIPLEDVNYMFKKYKNLFLADITNSSNIYIPLGGSYISRFQYYKDLIYKLNLLYAFWSQGIPLKLKYMKPKIGITNPFEEFELHIVKWSKGQSKKEKSIAQKIRKQKTKKDVVIEEVQKNLILQYHPNIKDLFDQTYNDIVSRGYWKL